ncbi:MAG: alpha/beta fold hydrolase, partial [Verrucomicrobiae bacterium]|nr:alpha/beta fold hydrolase [Verrucomicrobiae bacterium]
VYAVDVLRGTKGQPDYDPAFEEALAYGAKVIGKAVTPAATKNFSLDGNRWTYRDGDFEMSGILLKPEGKGPFPAVLISHGLGGSAESFGLNKAREFVQWGLVCIAPNYTHNVRAAGKRPGTPATAQTNYGASEENLRRARTCIELLRAMPDVDPKRIVAYGHSMGGFVTIGLAATMPDALKAAAITGSGVAPRAGFPAPSVELARKLRPPFLILHGSNDPVVRPEQSAALKEVLDRNHVPNERRLFEGEGHPIDQTRRDEVFRLIRQWFVQYGVLTK